MKEEIEAKEDRLSRVLRQARPAPALSPRFQESVWRCIERSDLEAEHLESPVWVERLLSLLLRPRLAIAGAMVLLLIGGGMGVLDGSAEARQAARDQYIASVAPYAVR
ncbi:MAG: hypothetical protein MUC91_04535 [Verrucomicrobia bacterium]|jgi:hypothetical protein|nr:hypothetical protein [Verrucomicrobiota bacterium]